jgi:hypothetical protein
MLKRLSLLASAATLSAFVALGDPTLGAECLKTGFPDSVKVGNSNLVLNGLGICKATFLAVKVYVAGLYLPAKASDSGQILAADRPWQFVLRFVHDVSASDIRGAFTEGFVNASGDKTAILGPCIDALNAQMVDFKTGQYLSFTNDPGKGVTADVNGAVGGPIEGADFATALLSIWIGKKPPNEDLKTGLLGGTCE